MGQLSGVRPDMCVCIPADEMILLLLLMINDTWGHVHVVEMLLQNMMVFAMYTGNKYKGIFLIKSRRISKLDKAAS